MGSSRLTNTSLKSYTSLNAKRLSTLSEFWHVYRHKTADVEGSVTSVLDSCEEVERTVADDFDVRLRNLDVLEVGAGQQPLRLKYFSLANRAVALDYDVFTQGVDLGGYWRIFRQNGSKRVVKTLLRKASGIDRAYWKHAEKRVGRLDKKLQVVQGDAHAMPWTDHTFDFVYSFSVFEHLADPAQCLDEVIRVLKPGGIFCISTHMYTSDSGAHDPRSFLPHHESPPLWAHLRPSHKSAVQPNAYCNGWRTSRWVELFEDKCPDVLLRHQPSPEWLRPELAALRTAGELSEYTDEELLTNDLWALWRKPILSSST